DDEEPRAHRPEDRGLRGEDRARQGKDERDMRRRTLRDLEVSAIGLGCMGMSAFYGATDEDEAVKTIQRALELGVDFIDTAQLYGPLTNELLVGRAIRGHRDEYVIATKFNRRMDAAKPGDMTTVGPPDGSAEHVRASIEGPLERLRPDYLDLHHHPLLPSPRGRRGAQRGDGWRDGGAGRAGQGPPHRPQRGCAGDDPPCERNSPAHRRADRVLAVEPGPRGGGAADMPRARDRVRTVL